MGYSHVGKQKWMIAWSVQVDLGAAATGMALLRLPRMPELRNVTVKGELSGAGFALLRKLRRPRVVWLMAMHSTALQLKKHSHFAERLRPFAAQVSKAIPRRWRACGTKIRFAKRQGESERPFEPRRRLRGARRWIDVVNSVSKICRGARAKSLRSSRVWVFGKRAARLKRWGQERSVDEGQIMSILIPVKKR